METFRRSGSSGLVWEDRFISEELNLQARKNKEGEEEFRELRPSRSVGTTGQLERSRSNGGGEVGGGGGRPYRTGKVSPALDPPSPKVSGCGFCGIFGNSSSSSSAAKKRKPRRR
ncbi:hypothetical protein Taro_048348 [Colocasia esculenta]|uniref:MAPK kinase substrate protein n=1 Tax=Colocasia esculenta TaxID=4460 RepID=A0A843X7T8_COLES|nr:hypothetical protein [Colocasia esculenta]